MSKWTMILALALLLSLGARATEAGDRGPFEGWIVDADTKEPVEGAVVSIEWIQGHIDSGSTHVDTAETLTDAKGHFFISSWWSFNPWKNLTTEGLVTIFKSGYEPIGHAAWRPMIDIEWGAPKGTLIWKFQKGRPVILLHKASANLLERRNKSFRVGPHGSNEKTRLFRREIDKEHDILYPK